VNRSISRAQRQILPQRNKMG